MDRHRRGREKTLDATENAVLPRYTQGFVFLRPPGRKRALLTSGSGSASGKIRSDCGRANRRQKDISNENEF
jgi:hypothetical protein